MMKELETSRLNLRKLSFEDLYDYYERLLSDGEVTKYLHFEPHQDIGESMQLLERTLERYGEGGCYCWAIARKEDEEFLGTIELTELEEERKCCSFTCMLAERWWGMGYGTEAVQEVLRFAMEELGIRLRELRLIRTIWFEKRGMLMLAFIGQAENTDFHLSSEVDEAAWVPAKEAIKLVHPKAPGVASYFLVEKYLEEIGEEIP